MTITKRIFILALFVFTFQSCNKDLLDTIPNDRLSSEIFWKTEKDATLAANGIYTYLEGADDFTNWDAMSDIGHVTLQYRAESNIEKGTYDASLSKVLSVWTNNYTGIQAANIFLDNVDKVKAINPVLIKQLKGEVKTLRCFFYIRLAQLYGDIPLITKEISLPESKTLVRTPVGQVWDFIHKELNEAADFLPVTQTEKGRITKGAAYALDARAMLFANRYAEAAAAAKKVMDLNVYDIYSSYQNLFSYAAEYNVEVILDKEFIKSTQSNNIFALTTPNSLYPKSNSFVPTDKMVDAYQMTNGKKITDAGSGFNPRSPYENRDPRLKYSIYVLGEVMLDGKIYDPRPGSGTADAIGYSESTTPTGFNVKKYLNKEDLKEPTNCGINLIFIRYAEVLLTYAEAKIALGEIDNTVINAINKIRQRPDVNMPPISIDTKEKMLDAVRNERMVELAFEGLRYFDIRRTKQAEIVIPGIVKGMTYVDNSGNFQTISLPAFQKVFNAGRDYLWPIPQREIELNRNLTQNKNW